MISTNPIDIAGERYHITLLHDEVMVSRWTGHAWTVAGKGIWEDGRITGCAGLDPSILRKLEAKLAAMLDGFRI